MAHGSHCRWQRGDHPVGPWTPSPRGSCGRCCRTSGWPTGSATSRPAGAPAAHRAAAQLAGVIHHFPAEGDGRASHANPSAQGPGEASNTQDPGGDRAPLDSGQERVANVSGESPLRHEPLNPCVAQTLKRLALVCREDRMCRGVQASRCCQPMWWDQCIAVAVASIVRYD